MVEAECRGGDLERRYCLCKLESKIGRQPNTHVYNNDICTIMHNSVPLTPFKQSKCPRLPTPPKQSASQCPYSIRIRPTRVSYYPLLIRPTMAVRHFERSDEYDSLGPYERSPAYIAVRKLIALRRPWSWNSPSLFAACLKELVAPPRS